jgi:hypothetical protein
MFPLLLLIAVIATASSIAVRQKYKNLQVLPQDISEKKLDSIMVSYTKALKISCDFCHIPPKVNMLTFSPDTKTIDYSLDNPMKENARKMMRMTININSTYFHFDSIVKPEYLNVISCNTCHRGDPFPANQ